MVGGWYELAAVRSQTSQGPYTHKWRPTVKKGSLRPIPSKPKWKPFRFFPVYFVHMIVVIRKMMPKNPWNFLVLHLHTVVWSRDLFVPYFLVLWRYKSDFFLLLDVCFTSKAAGFTFCHSQRLEGRGNGGNVTNKKRPTMASTNKHQLRKVNRAKLTVSNISFF